MSPAQLVPYAGQDRRERPLVLEGVYLDREVLRLFRGGAHTADISCLLMVPESKIASALARARDRERQL